jgi:hypothetical protein
MVLNIDFLDPYIQKINRQFDILQNSCNISSLMNENDVFWLKKVSIKQPDLFRFTRMNKKFSSLTMILHECEYQRNKNGTSWFQPTNLSISELKSNALDHLVIVPIIISFIFYPLNLFSFSIWPLWLWKNIFLLILLSSSMKII